VIAVLAWLLATCLLALSPLLYFISGSSDGATEAGRVGVAAIPALMAWPLLVLAIGLARRWRGRVGAAARRALLLMLVAGGVLVLARRLGGSDAIFGDGSWIAFWAAAAVIWVMVSAALARRPSADA
jgi:hypothetical protein